MPLTVAEIMESAFVEHGQLIGVVTRVDVLEALTRD